MIVHVRDECTWRVLISSDIIYSGHYLESLALSMAKPSLSLETRVVCLPDR